MKVEDLSALEVQWFYHKHKVLPKGDESSWENYTKYAAQSATTKRTFIVTEKTFTDTRNICVRNVASVCARRFYESGKNQSVFLSVLPGLRKSNVSNIAFPLIPALHFNSNEWHADETVVKIQGEKYYLWLILDSKTRFVFGFHLDRHRDSSQAFTILEAVKSMG